MSYSAQLELAMEVGYHLAMAGAETYRVEESINRILHVYGIESQVFAIPNCLTVSVHIPGQDPITRMRRIGNHGNDLYAVEQFSNLSRRICAEAPDPAIANQWLAAAKGSLRVFPLPVVLLAYFLGASGFSVLFGGGWREFLAAGFCGVLVGIVTKCISRFFIENTFFSTISAALVMGLAAYGIAAWIPGLITDAIIIGASMPLVPGLLFTNAMRDIINGDTNSGLNRIVTVLLIAVAIAAGTGTAWTLSTYLWGACGNAPALSNGYLIQSVCCLIGCTGFAIIFNIHGQGTVLCTLGGMITWLVYLITVDLTGNDLVGYLTSTLFAAVYSEVMARVRKYPAISYLLVSIFPLLPGAGIYYAMTYAVGGNIGQFAEKGLHTAAIAGIMAVSILFGSTTVSGICHKRVKHKRGC